MTAKRCDYCPEVATWTAIGANGAQRCACDEHKRRAVLGLLNVPRVMSLVGGPEQTVNVSVTIEGDE